MTLDPIDFSSRLTQAIGCRSGKAVTELLLLDPRGRYAHAFIQYMDRVGEGWVEAAYLKPLAVLADRVDSGAIADERELFKVLYGIQRRVALNLSSRTLRKANPLVRLAGGRGPKREPRPLFVPLGRPEAAAGRESDPHAAVEQAELLELLSAEVNGMGPVQAQVFDAVCRFEAEHGSRFGAFRAVARSAEVDAGGRILSLRPAPAEPRDVGPPLPATVRRVRRLYFQAAEQLGIGEGPPALPGGVKAAGRRRQTE